MAEKTANGQQPKRRGRPPKVNVQPVVNETPSNVDSAPERLEMVSKKSSQVALVDVMKDLSGLYKRTIDGGTWCGGWDFNQYNPFLQNDRLKMLNTLPGTMSREELTKALKDPGNNEQGLRAEAWTMSSTQYLYYKILRMAQDIPMFKYYVVPELLEKEEYKKDDFVNEDKLVDEWLDTFSVPVTLKKTAMEVKREGKATYLLRNSISGEGKKKKVNYATWQKLPSEYVKLVKIGEHGFIASFNMMLFLNPAFSVCQYPQFIRDIWEELVGSGAFIPGGCCSGMTPYGRFSAENGKQITPGFDVSKLVNFSYEYKGSTGKEVLRGNLEIINRSLADRSYFFWVQLPQELCYTFCSDSSNPWVVPDTSGLLLALDELADYDVLQGLIESTPLTALLVAEAETIPNPNPGQDQSVLNPETIAGIQEHFNSSTSTNLEALFAPLKNFKLLSLPAQPNGSEISANATKNIITRAGLGGLVTTTDKPSVSQVKTAQLLAEAEAHFVTLQFESVLNMIINDLIGTRYKWKLHIWGGIFTFNDEIKRDKELFVSGATFVLPKLASAYDFTIRDTRAAQRYIDSFNIYDDFKTVTQVRQENINEQKSVTDTTSTGQVGRPAKDDSDVDNDNTAASKDGGLDTADTREYAMREPVIGKCVVCGAECDGILCDDCREKYDEDNMRW